MSLFALVIGFGSIGKRHAKILDAMDEISHVSVLSSQSGLPYETILSLEDIPAVNPDYLVISSATDQHYPHLKFLERHIEGRKILVEKPLFDSMVDFQVSHNDVYVGYNLRFHPMIKKIKDMCKGRRLWNIHVFCGSYLPDWRPGRDYRETSSAMRDSGGGVLLDLSHELDYIQWLAGPLEVDHAVSEKVSDLEIDSDDLLLFSGRTNNGVFVHIGLNYFTREPIRRIIIDGQNISIQGDLITKSLSMMVDGEVTNLSWPELDRNETYRVQHKAILKGDTTNICTFNEGLNTMCLIEKIRTWRN